MQYVLHMYVCITYVLHVDYVLYIHIHTPMYVCRLCIFVYMFIMFICTVYLEILAVIKFGDSPEIRPNALLAEFKFGSLPK